MIKGIKVSSDIKFKILYHIRNDGFVYHEGKIILLGERILVKLLEWLNIRVSLFFIMKNQLMENI